MASDKVELRGLCPADLAQAIDALAHADGVDRNHYGLNPFEFRAGLKRWRA